MLGIMTTWRLYYSYIIMPIYYGNSKDGSGAKVADGVYLSSCGKFWGSKPLTIEEERYFRRMEWKQRIKKIANKK